MAEYLIVDRPIILDAATGKPVGWRNPDGTLTFVPAFDDPVTASAAELNTLDGVTVSTAELNKLAGAPFTLTTVSTTPASGSCAVQLALKSAAGAALSAAVAGTMYVSDVDGAIVAAVTSLAALTNGTLAETTAGQVALFSTTATGLIGVTLTAGAATYYITIIAPNGSLLISDAIVVDA